MRMLPLAKNGVIFRAFSRNFLNGGLAFYRKCHSEEYQTRHKVQNDNLQS